MEGGSGGRYFILREAECEDEDEDAGYSGEDTGSGDTDDGFLDDEEWEQGESLALLQEQQRQDSEKVENAIKRKLLGSPLQGYDTVDQACTLSPRLQEIRITPQKKKLKKRLQFGTPEEHEVVVLADPRKVHREEGQWGGRIVVEAQVHNVYSPPHTSTPVRPEEPVAELNSSADSGVPEEPHQEDSGPVTHRTPEEMVAQARGAFNKTDYVSDLLKAAHSKSVVLGQLRSAFSAAFSEITRPFKSNKTMSGDWVVGVAGTDCTLTIAARSLLKEHCTFFCMRDAMAGKTPCLLMLLQFTHQKNRDTVMKVIRHMLCVHEVQIVANPPRTASVPAAIYWYRMGEDLGEYTFRHGTYPDWVAEQAMLAHSSERPPQFELTKMVQWAYDHDLTDESQIALEYASIARKERNAQAFLSSNSQAKYVRDCAIMVRHYKRAEAARMTMSEWIHERCGKVDPKDRDDEKGWRAIVQFLRRQGIEFPVFSGALKQWLKGTPKKNCIVLQGPPDTGKSLFAMSLIKFMGGSVASYVNSRSHFWLQPLAGTKVGLIDDATKPFWDYCDTYLRTAFDGNPVSVDVKHRAPVQMKFPPLLITTNVAVQEDMRWMYLHSRVRIFTFPTGVHIRDGSTIEDKHWRSFFTKFWQTLELSDQEEEEEEQEVEEPQQNEAERSYGGDKPSTTIRFNRRGNT